MIRDAPPCVLARRQERVAVVIADLLRRAAAAMREDAEMEAVLRQGDPYFQGEASRFEQRWTPRVAAAVADTLRLLADHFDSSDDDSDDGYYLTAAVVLARAYLGEASW